MRMATAMPGACAEVTGSGELGFARASRDCLTGTAALGKLDSVEPMRISRTHPGSRRLALILALGVLGLVFGCKNHQLGTMSDSTFVAVMGGLRHLPLASMTDSASRQRARDSILTQYRVTPAQLEAAAGVLAANPDRAAEVWEQVEKRVK